MASVQRANIAGEQFSSEFFFPKSLLSSLDCMHRTGPKILGLQGTFPNCYAVNLPLLALVKDRDNYNLT